MLNNLIYKLSYKFHRIGFYICSIEYYYQDNCENQNSFKCFIKALINNLRIFNYKYGYYEYLEIPITTKCSLRCTHCSNLIPCYEKQSDYDINILIKSIRKFLQCINNIVYVRVLGGEPFLSKNLYRVIRELLKSNKIQRIEIVTNGTIIPTDKKIINILKNNRIIVCISQYPIINYNKLISFLEKNNIKYRLDKMSFWMDYGDTEKRHKSKRNLIKQFASCNNVCKSLVNGQIHLCPRSSHGTDLGIIKNNESDYLDLLDKSLSISDKKVKLKKLLKKKYIKACDYCDFGTKKCKKIPVAEQSRLKYK